MWRKNETTQNARSTTVRGLSYVDEAVRTLHDGADGEALGASKSGWR